MKRFLKKSRPVFAVTLAAMIILMIVSSLTAMASEEASTNAPAENVAVEDGVYVIENMKTSSETRDHEVMDVRDMSKEAGIDMILSNKSGGDSQKFQFTKVEENVYNIQNVNSGLYLSIDENFGEFPTLVQSDKKGTFSFEKVKEDWVMIKDNESGTYLKVDDTQHKAVRPILTSEKGDSLYLKWRLLDPASVSAATEKTADTSSQSISQATADSASVSQSSPTMWIIIGACALVIAVIAVVIVLISKSKKK